MIILKYFDRGI